MQYVKIIRFNTKYFFNAEFRSLIFFSDKSFQFIIISRTRGSNTDKQEDDIIHKHSIIIQK